MLNRTVIRVYKFKNTIYGVNPTKETESVIKIIPPPSATPNKP